MMRVCFKLSDELQTNICINTEYTETNKFRRAFIPQEQGKLKRILLLNCGGAEGMLQNRLG